MDTGVIRFLACDLKLLEIDENKASASLTEAFEERFGYRPDFQEITGDACTGDYVPTPNSDNGWVVVQRRANGVAVRRALWLLAAKHTLNEIRLSFTQPQFTTSMEDEEWEQTRPQPYDQSQVTVWPVQPNWPVRDRVVVAYADETALFVHRARRNPQCEWAVPAGRVEEALSFSSVERAQTWIDRRGASERHPLQPRYRSAAAALLDQAAREQRATRQP